MKRHPVIFYHQEQSMAFVKCVLAGVAAVVVTSVLATIAIFVSVIYWGIRWPRRCGISGLDDPLRSAPDLRSGLLVAVAQGEIVALS
jgi:hypothetical protein